MKFLQNFRFNVPNNILVFLILQNFIVFPKILVKLFLIFIIIAKKFN